MQGETVIGRIFLFIAVLFLICAHPGERLSFAKDGAPQISAPALLQAQSTPEILHQARPYLNFEKTLFLFDLTEHDFIFTTLQRVSWTAGSQQHPLLVLKRKLPEPRAPPPA